MEAYMKKTATIYPARTILTMNPEQPEAQAVAVMDGRILSVGSLVDIMNSLKDSPFSEFEVDTVFADKVLMPGIVETHTHLMIPALEYANHFVSQIPWPNPQGGFFATYPNKESVLARLRELDAILPPGALLWGTHYDDNAAGGCLTREDLDSVSTERPVLVGNQVFHRFWCNTRLLEMCGVMQGETPHGVMRDENGAPNGTLVEISGFRVVARVFPEIAAPAMEKLYNIIPLFRSQGITTVSEMFGGVQDDLDREIALCRQLCEQETHGLRCVLFPYIHMAGAALGSREAAIERLTEIMRGGTETFKVGGAKLYHDGSIISHTSPLDWPGYMDGAESPQMQYSAEEIRYFILELHKLGITTVTHTNTNLAVQTVLDAVEEAQVLCSRVDIRHRMEHCYTITSAQLRRAKALGVGVQFFTPQIYYYGDSHVKVMGLDRANHMTPTGTAERLGVSWGFHSDPPGTPQLPWVGAWATVQRKTLRGKVLGPGQRVSVGAALRAMTLEAAWQLRMEDMIGSIEFGKKADFCVLEADPTRIDPDELKDMPVWGTVMNGAVFQK